jgi:hypothetical protein
MSQLTFRITPDGLVVDVLVNHQAAVLIKRPYFPSFGMIDGRQRGGIRHAI